MKQEESEQTSSKTKKQVGNNIFESPTSIYEKQKQEKYINLHLAKDWFYLQSEFVWQIGFWVTLLYATALLSIYFLKLDIMIPYVEGVAFDL